MNILIEVVTFERGIILGLYISVNKSVKLTPGEERILKELKKSYREMNHDVYIYVQSVVSGKRPDFIIIDLKRGISILEVKDWSENYIEDVNKRKVKLVDRECEHPVIQLKGYRNLLSSALFSRNCETIDEDDISLRIIFTSLSKEARNNPKLSLLFNSAVNYLFEEDCREIQIDNLFEEHTVLNMEKDLNMIRVALFPELEIINIKDEIVEQEDIKALDFEQEEFAKKIPYGHYMVTGIPGSGKTVILLARAIYLVKEKPDWKVLILTYNKSLSNKLNAQLNKMAEQFRNDVINREINLDHIEIKNFHSIASAWCAGKRKPVTMDNNEWFNEEMVRLALQNAKEFYDAILIDEYQDFRISWIQLCVALCKSYQVKDKILKNIFLAGDRLQSIYNTKDVSWKSLGLDMRGRSKLLKTSYRSAKEHMSLALEFLKNDNKLQLEVEKFYKDDSGDTELVSLNKGRVEFISGDSRMIGDKIMELKELGYRNEDILILCPTNNYCKTILNKMPKQIKYEMNCIHDLNDDNMKSNIILTTYHSSKGLEAKVVFLVAIDKIFVSDLEAEQLKRKIIYVGITRASERLYIYHDLNEQGRYYQELKILYEKLHGN